MTGITHKAVKSHGEKGLATEWNDDHEFTGNPDMEQYQFLNQVIENRVDYPAGPVVGQVVYRSDFNNFFGWNGTAWQSLTPVATVVVAADGTGNFLTIQEGIDALPATGGVVYVKEGIYIITVAITFPNNNISLIGAGKSTEIRSATDIDFINTNTKPYAIIDKISFEQTGIKAGTGVDLSGEANSFVTNCFFKNLDIGVRLDSTLCKVTSNYFDACGAGIQGIFGKHQNAIMNNICENCTGTGITINGNEHTVMNNICVSSGVYGIYINTGDNNVVIGNVCTNSTSTGITLLGGANNNIISGNICSGSINFDGITVGANGDRNIISGNQCLNNNDDGISISAGTCDNNIVVGNVCVGNGTQIEDAGVGTIVEHNIVA